MADKSKTAEKQQGKKNKKKTVGSWQAVVILTLFIVAAVLAVQWIEQERVLTRQKERLKELNTQYAALLAQIDETNREIEQSDSLSYIEYYLRNKLGMIKDGEIIIKIEAPSDSNDTSMENDGSK